MKEVTKELFKRYYIDEGKTRKEVAAIFGILPYQVSNYAFQFELKKPTGQERLKLLQEKYPQSVIEPVYLEHGYGETVKRFGIRPGDLDQLVKIYGIGFRGKQARLEAGIDVEDFKKFFIDENHSFQETADHFGVTGLQLRIFVRKHGIKKDRKQVAKVIQKSLQEKYGVENPNYIPGVRGKREKTCQEKYGVSCMLLTSESRQKSAEVIRTPEVRTKISASRAEHQDQITENIRKTLEERYGGLGFGSDIIREQIEAVVEAKYGEKNIRKTEWYQNHKKEVFLEKYGADCAMNVPEFREKIINTNRERYGVDYFVQSEQYRHSPLNSSDSKPNREFAKLLEERGIEFEREFPIENRSFDFKIDRNLVEVNPYSTHNSTWGIKGGTGKDRLYHKEKSDLAAKYGYSCLHVWDWDDREKVLELLQPRVPVYARKCELKEIEQRDANIFLKRYHLQGGAKMQKVCLGLYLEGDLVEVMTFGPPRFNKKFEWELIRLCTKTGIRVLGGSQRLWKYFLKTYNPNSVISYCDRSKFSGKIYGDLGFILRAAGMPSRHWYSPELGKHVTDNGLRLRGFDLLLGNLYGKFGKGTINDDLMREHGFVEIWDAGQAVWVWNKKEI